MALGIDMYSSSFQGALFSAGTLALLFGAPSVYGLLRNAVRKTNLTESERQFIGGLEQNWGVLLASELAASPEYSRSKLDKIRDRNKLLFRCTLGGYRTLAKKQDGVCSTARSELAAYISHYRKVSRSFR